MSEPAFDFDVEDATSCPHCGRPFSRARYRTLHVGLEHYNRLGDDEREAFVAEYREETAEIKRFRLKALALLIALYFGFFFVYLAVA